MGDNTTVAHDPSALVRRGHLPALRAGRKFMIEGIDRITYGVEDIAACRKFFLDWGLKLVREEANGLDFESLNGCELLVRKADDTSLPPAVEPGPTLREVIWGVTSEADLAALSDVPKVDPNGIGLGFRVDAQATGCGRGHAGQCVGPCGAHRHAEPGL